MARDFEMYDVLSGIVHDPQFFAKLSPARFEELLAFILSAKGYEVELTPRTRDGGRDMLLSMTDPLGGRIRAIALAKQLSRPVSISTVREFYGVMAAERDLSFGLIVSTGDFTRDARAFAREHPTLRLIGLAELAAWAVDARAIEERHTESLAYRLDRLPIARRFGRLTLRPDEALPPPELLLPKLHLPPEYANRLIQVQHIPLEILQIIFGDPRTVHALTPREFEEFIAEMVDKLGFIDVKLTPKSNDGGRDVIASKIIHNIPLTFFFECKKYADDNVVQLDTLRALLGVVAHHGTTANIGVLVTTSRFTQGCKDLIASECRLDGKDYDGIVDWIGEYQRRQDRLIIKAG